MHETTFVPSLVGASDVSSTLLLFASLNARRAFGSLFTGICTLAVGFIILVPQFSFGAVTYLDYFPGVPADCNFSCTVADDTAVYLNDDGISDVSIYLQFDDSTVGWVDAYLAYFQDTSCTVAIDTTNNSRSFNFAAGSILDTQQVSSVQDTKCWQFWRDDGGGYDMLFSSTSDAYWIVSDVPTISVSTTSASSTDILALSDLTFNAVMIFFASIAMSLWIAKILM